MVLVKCKSCGNEFEYDENMMLAECPYCGSQQSMTELNSEIIINADNEIYPSSDVYQGYKKEKNSAAVKSMPKKKIFVIISLAVIVCLIIGIVVLINNKELRSIVFVSVRIDYAVNADGIFYPFFHV